MNEMTRDGIADICRSNTSLSAMESESLRRFGVILPFISDLAQAQASLYAIARDDSCFVVLAHAVPRTSFVDNILAAAGEVIPRREEPLIERTFETGHPRNGWRETETGAADFEMFTLPVFDPFNDALIAVISIERAGDRDAAGYRVDEPLRTSRIILDNAHGDDWGEMLYPISSNDGIIIADGYDRIIYANDAALHICRVLGVLNPVGLSLFDRALISHVTRETVSKERPHEREVVAGGLVLLQRYVRIAAGGETLRTIMIVRDITEIREKEREIRVKSAVIKEIHHRVKNNLQTIASLLRLQARRSNDNNVRAALAEAVNRILSISVVHEFLSEESTAKINVKKIAADILEMLRPMMLANDFKLTKKFSGDDIILSAERGTNIALVINELIANSIEHGFAGRSSGTIGLDVSANDDGYMIELWDDGEGLPSDFDLNNPHSLGISIVRMLVEDMGGTFALEGGKLGAHAKITITRDDGRGGGD